MDRLTSDLWPFTEINGISLQGGRLFIVLWLEAELGRCVVSTSRIGFFGGFFATYFTENWIKLHRNGHFVQFTFKQRKDTKNKVTQSTINYTQKAKKKALGFTSEGIWVFEQNCMHVHGAKKSKVSSVWMLFGLRKKVSCVVINGQTSTINCLFAKQLY